MRSKLLLSGLLATVVIVPALAQSTDTPPAATPAPAARDSGSSVTAARSDLWRASKLVGLNVYNDQNEKLGDISEILLDKSGKVNGVIIGVGGFLGMGQHDIMVEMSKLKFVDEPMRTSTGGAGSGAGPGVGANPAGGATTGAAANRPAGTTTTSSTEKNWYPDHAVMSGANKDQLKAMPQFKYN